MPSTFTTDLPDEDQPVLGNGVEDEVHVDRESAVSNNGSVRIQIRETGEASWDSDAASFGEFVGAYDTITMEFVGLPDGEELEVRARTETEHVDGAWADPVSIVTQFPGVTAVDIVGVTPESVTVGAQDNADNENGIYVWRREELDPNRETGFGDWERIATLDPVTGTGEFEYVDDAVQSNHAYEYYFEPFTEHTSASSTTVSTTTEVSVPSEGWYIVLEDDDGDQVTIPHSVIDENRPRLEPETSAVARWTIDITPNSVLREWKRSEAYIYYDGSLWMRGPYTRYAPEGGAGDAAARLEGLGAIQHLKAGGLAFEVASERGYEAFERFVDEELPDWVVDVTTPSSDTIDENLLVQDGTSQSELESIFGTPGDMDAWTADNGELHPLVAAHHVDARDTDGSYNITDGSEGGSDDYVDGFAAYLDSASSKISTSVTLPHTIPEADVGLAVRQGADDSPAVEWRINGTTVDSVTQGAGLVFDWDDNAAGAFDGTGYSGGDLSGTVDIDIEVTAHSTGEALAVDWIVLYDKRYFDISNFPNSTDSNNQLPGPSLHPQLTLSGAEFSQEYNIAEATISTTIDDVSNPQRLQATNDGGNTWLPNDGSEQNTQTVTANFATAGTFGTNIQGRITLGAYGTRTDTTPTEGFKAQTLSDWELRITTNALRVIDDQTYTGDPYSILDSIADDSGLVFVPDYLEDQLALNAFAPGDEVRDVEWTVEDADPVDTTEGYFNTVTVFGPEQDDGTRPSVQASSQAEIDRVGEVEGPAKFRPDATTDEELKSIARTLLAEGISKDTITGSLEISSQFVQPGYAYRVPEFKAIDDRDNPAYVLQSATFEWGTMELDFEARNSLARAIRSIETEVRTTKRAL